jgi:hypothetical protein
MPQITPNTRLAKDTSQVIDRVVDGEALVIHLQSGEYFSLNPIGTRIWELLSGEETLGQIANVLVEEYDVTLEQAQADITALATDLIQERLAVVV